MEKAEARALIKSRIQALKSKERKQKDQIIRQHLLNLPAFRTARSVMLFASLPDEVSTKALVRDALKLGKTIALPRVVKEEGALLAVRFSASAGLARGAYNIYEPIEDEVIPVEELDFVLVPARAFDRKGNRLGRGKGFYDRFLSRLPERTIKCVVGYDCQLLEEVPHDAGDAAVDLVVTESGVIQSGADSGAQQ
jgi:5-formyltetrahydrofolate cyclo-ligase